MMNNKERCRIYYWKNRKSEIDRIKKIQKKVRYCYEKTPKQRELRNIKRKTRYHFPLLNKICQICGDKATEHHHNTQPIQYDKFIYVCHNCHILIDYKEVSEECLKI